ncbi:uncharacterized protein LOC131649323 [Vicia villosa]|uniref:uncharacterized protein LOC131649323 n=1 Tax=Vicia villosa TaxID=3911 RepID=UPI00273BDDF5|nr:uncharacterized protein LOC131649323 [Vicia villosa]
MASGSAPIPLPNNINVPKNAPGNKSDPAWKHALPVPNSKKWKCKFCREDFSGGVYRIKHHLAGTSKDVKPCRAVPDEVKKEIVTVVVELQTKLIQKSNLYDIEEPTIVGKRKSQEEILNTSNMFKKRGVGVTSQATINNIWKKEMREDACKAIALCIYNNAIPFNISNNEEWKTMFELVAKHGPGFKPPSNYEVRGKYLNFHMNRINDELDEHRAVWKKLGCTIMTDGWTDRRRRTILNFLVNSPKGTVFLKSIDASDKSKTADKVFKMIDDVVAKVREDNVVQVVTDNAANYKAAGDLLMQKRKQLYWTPCAAHCTDLMLEDFEKKITLHKETIACGKKITTFIYARTSLISLLHKFTIEGDLIRPGLTRFATSYLTLGCLYENMASLKNMFTSNEWKSSKLAKSNDGIFVEGLVTDKKFWKDVVYCIRGAFPLIRVLCMVDSDEKPAMGFIYEEMNRAKEKIRSDFKGVGSSFLNTILHYALEYVIDNEVADGMYECLNRMVPDLEKHSKIDYQLESFKEKDGKFGCDLAILALKTKTPTQWWGSYGSAYPELQWFAMRVLSLTCSSSGCERNWSVFERVHTKKRIRLKQKTMNDVVYVMTNSKLGKKKEARKSSYNFYEDIPSEDEWQENRDGNGHIHEDIILNDGEDVSSVGVVGDDLDVPPSPINDDPIDEELEANEDEELEENEDENEDEDDYPYMRFDDI